MFKRNPVMTGRAGFYMKLKEMTKNFTYFSKMNTIAFYNVIKAVLVVLLVIFVAVLLAGNADSDRSADDVARNIAPELFQEEAGGEENPAEGEDTDESQQETPDDTEADGVFDGMGQATALDFKRIFGLNAEDYDGTVYFKPISQMDVEELLIVRLKSDDQAEALENAVEERIKNQKTSFDGYGAAQCALLEKAIVKRKGNFLFYCVSPEAEKYCDAFLDAI